MVSRRKQARPVKRSVADWDKSLLDSTTVDAYCLPVVDKCTSSKHWCASALAGCCSEGALPSNTAPAAPESSSNQSHSVLPNSCSCAHTFASSSRSHPYWISHEESNNNAEYGSVSPLKCLESYVKPKEELTLRHAAKRVPSVQPSCYGSQRNALTNAASSPYMLQTKTEAERSSNGESNALCELSELVHKVGSVRHSTCTEVHAESNCAKSVFTCLQCSCSFETLDHLVFHISTTKHFTRIAAKHIEPVAPWEKGVVATQNRDKERSQQARILECTLCGQTFEGDAGYHLRFKHKLDSFMDWISVIKIAEAPPNPDKNAFALNKLQTLVNGVKK